MKRIFIALLAFSSISSFGIFRLGVEGGLVSSKGSSSTSTTTTSRSGFAVGPAVELGLGFDWHIQVEGLYIQKGYTVPSALGDITTKFDYWEFPVLLKYVFDIPIIKPFLEAGPYFSFKLKSEMQGVGSTTTTALSGVKSTDMGISFGAGADLFISPISSLFAVARYDLGLGNIYDSTSTSNVKLNSWLLMCGIMFGF